MKSCKLLTLAVTFLTLSAASALAQVGKGLSGPHYNLNIIGVPKNKTADMTDSNRHTIFVPLETVNKVKIYVTGDSDPKQDGTQCGDKFQVLDGNATDGEAELLVPCELGGTLSYDVFAVGLGKPNGNANVDVVCEFNNSVILDTNTANLCMLEENSFDFEVKRESGKPHRENISFAFRASGCIDTGGAIGCDAGDTTFNNVWIFNIPELLSYYWDYDNNGLKLMQVRFYETTSGSWGTQ